MNAEIVELTEELQSLEAELDKVRREYKEKEENNMSMITKHKSK